MCFKNRNDVFFFFRYINNNIIIVNLAAAAPRKLRVIIANGNNWPSSSSYINYYDPCLAATRTLSGEKRRGRDRSGEPRRCGRIRVGYIGTIIIIK